MTKGQIQPGQHASAKKLRGKLSTLKDSISFNQNILRKDIDDDENMIGFLQNILYELKLTTGKLKINRAINILNRGQGSSKSRSRYGSLNKSVYSYATGNSRLKLEGGILSPSPNVNRKQTMDGSRRDTPGFLS
jgi:hypothetical protein